MGSTRSEMDQAIRDAYLSAYKLALSRHSPRSTISATSTKVTATASTTVTRPAEDTFRGMTNTFFLVCSSKLITFMVFLWWYIVLPALAALFVYFIYRIWNWGEWANDLIDQMQLAGGWLDQDYDSALANAAVIIALCFVHPMQMSRIITNELRVAFGNTKAWIGRKLNDIRYNQYRDLAYLRYQEITFFIGRHKPLIFILFCGLAVISAIMKEGEKNVEKERFVKWVEFQQQYDRPVPQVLLRAGPREQGSNSHYRRRQEPDEPPEPLELEEWDEALDVDALPVQTSMDDSYEPPPPGTTPYKKTVESAREENTGASPLPSFVRKGNGLDEFGDALTSEPILFEKIVEIAWEENIAANRPRTQVGKKLVYCMACQQWHCCELPY